MVSDIFDQCYIRILFMFPTHGMIFNVFVNCEACGATCYINVNLLSKIYTVLRNHHFVLVTD